MPKDRRFLILLLTLTVLVRGGALIAQKDRLADDIDGYLGIAGQIAAGEGYSNPNTGEPTAYRPPFYPWLLAGVLKLGAGKLGIAILHLLLGVATVYLTWRLGVRLNLGSGAKWAAALIAFDPLLIQYSTVPMTETLCTFLGVVALDLLVPTPASKARQLACGIVLGLSILSRPTFLVFAGLMILIWIVKAGKAKEWKPFPWAVPLGLLIALLPWTIRNAIVLDWPKPTTTHGGYTLLLGNNPVFYEEVVLAPWGTTWNGKSLAVWQDSLEEEMEQAGVLAEVERDRYLYEKARGHIKENPGLFLRATLLRFVRFWNVLPPESARSTIHRLWIRGCEFTSLRSLEKIASPVEKLVTFGVALCYSVLIGSFLFGVFRIHREEWPAWWLLLLLIASFCLVHLVYWSNTRMRAPVMPAIVLIAVRAWFANVTASQSRTDGAAEGAQPSHRPNRQ